jgi:hypothetical protein
MEQFRIHRKLFAIINQNQISLKCTPQQYVQEILKPGIVPAKKMSRYQMKIASFAILADNTPNWRPSKYEDELCAIDFVGDCVTYINSQKSE